MCFDNAERSHHFLYVLDEADDAQRSAEKHVWDMTVEALSMWNDAIIELDQCICDDSEKWEKWGLEKDDETWLQDLLLPKVSCGEIWLKDVRSSCGIH
jgi:hypothetical protein